MMNGRVIGGHHLNAGVTAAPIGSDLIVQSGLKWRRLNEEQVSEWTDVTPAAKSGMLSGMGQAATSAMLPRFIGKGASAAVGAAFDGGFGASKTIRVDWADGKRSLIKLPEKMYKHLEIALENRRGEAPTKTVEELPAPSAPAQPDWENTAAEHAFSLAKGMLDHHKATRLAKSAKADKEDVTEQLVKLASLRNGGVITEEEFVAKKTELLSRM